MEISPNDFKCFMEVIVSIECCAKEAAILFMCDTLEELGYGEGIQIFKTNYLGESE